MKRMLVGLLVAGALAGFSGQALAGETDKAQREIDAGKNFWKSAFQVKPDAAARLKSKLNQLVDRSAAEVNKPQK